MAEGYRGYVQFRSLCRETSFKHDSQKRQTSVYILKKTQLQKKNYQNIYIYIYIYKEIRNKIKDFEVR